MYHNRANYWSLSKFAKWIRRTFGAMEPTDSATMKEWSEFHKQDKKQTPFVTWFVEEFLDGLQNFVMWPTDKLWDIRYYLMNRFVTKTHYLRTGLEPGKWYDLDTRLLHGMFEELVDFVEVEKAWMNVAFDSEKKKSAPWWRRILAARYLILKEWRDPVAGLEHLHWEMALKYDDEWMDKSDPNYGQPTHQAIAAEKQHRLYNWWKNVRPNRPDPYDISGWSAYCDSKRTPGEGIFESFEDRTEEERQRSSEMLNRLNEIEKQYDEEDAEMMHLLIDIRQSLWT